MQERLQFRPVGDRRKPGRLGKGNQVGRNGHTHVMPSAQQFAADSDGRLDIAASSITCHGELHRGSSPFRCRARRHIMGIGHYLWILTVGWFRLGVVSWFWLGLALGFG